MKVNNLKINFDLDLPIKGRSRYINITKIFCIENEKENN